MPFIKKTKTKTNKKLKKIHLLHERILKINKPNRNKS